MFNLKTRVDFKEVEGLCLLIQYKLHRSCISVIHLSGQLHCGLLQLKSSFIVEVRRGGFLNDFLVSALRRAVPLAQGNHMPLPIAKNLDFDVACLLYKLLDEHATVAEIVLTQSFNAVVSLIQLLACETTLHADTTTTCRAFEHHWVTNVLRFTQCLLLVVKQPRTREKWHIGLGGKVACRVFQSERTHLLCCGP